MATIFKYNNEYYQCINLKKKLKRLRIDETDIEILFEGELSQSDLEKKFLELTQVNKDIDDNDNVKVYYFLNPKTKETITSIYPTLDDFGKYGEGFEPVNKYDIALNQVRECKKAHPEWFSTKERDKQIFERILK